MLCGYLGFVPNNPKNSNTDETDRTDFHEIYASATSRIICVFRVPLYKTSFSLNIPRDGISGFY